MASLDDIRKAKEIGNNIRAIRETQNLSLRAMATIVGFSINQVVSLESGNYFAFHQNLDEFCQSATHCLEILGADKERSLEETPVFLNHREMEVSIPAFLKKSA
jgi:transcriptional regulator with XRE-family HTH domain